ncbi:MAG: PA4642 family protein [Porticoccaceae bacterium]
MSLKKDKQKVLGEVFDDERVKSFLDYQAPNGVSTDFHLLEKAYRGMNIDNFVTFLNFFKEAGHDLNAANPDGKTLKQIAGEHGHGAEYVEALTSAGAA